jgi:hypothetical protein
MKIRLGFAAIAFLLASVMAQAVNPPEMTEGLWSIHTQTVANPGNKKTDNTSTICRSHAYDQYSLDLEKKIKGCSTVNESLQGNKYTIQTHCVMGATTVESKSVVTFEGTSVAHSESHATYSPALTGFTEMTMTQEQKYLGSCPAGAQPGDLTQADGTVVHLWKH